MSNTLRCPNCRHNNPSDGTECEICGTALGSETTIWKKSDLLEIERPAVTTTEFKKQTLYLYVAGADNQAPLQISDRSPVVLGRGADNVPAPNQAIDLTPFHAYSLGVSRQHALITYDEVGYTLEDLGSSNGTLLNGNRLVPGQAYPLRSGDYMQLGELLMLVYFI